MRSGRVVRYSIVAAAAAVSLAVWGTLPAQAQPAAPASAAQGVSAPRESAQPVICLVHSIQFCMATNANPVSDILTDETTQIGIQAAAALIVAYILIIAGKGRKPPEYKIRVSGYYPKNYHGWPTTMCIGAWGYNQHLQLDSCSDRHAVYWLVYCIDNNCNNGWHLWNTYSKGYLITGGPPHTSDPEWIHQLTQGDYFTWANAKISNGEAKGPRDGPR